MILPIHQSLKRKNFEPTNDDVWVDGMEALPIVFTAVYACMGVYNGVKTLTSMYQDSKRLRGYIKQRFSPAKHLSPRELVESDPSSTSPSVITIVESSSPSIGSNGSIVPYVGPTGLSTDTDHVIIDTFVLIDRSE